MPILEQIQLLTSFFNYLEFEKRYSPHTLEAYKSDISQFQDFVQYTYSVSDLSDAKPMHIRSWMVALHELKISNRSINRKISALKTFYHFLRKRNGMELNPLRKVINPKVEKRLPVTVRKELMDTLLDGTEKAIGKEHTLTSFQLQQHKLIIEVLYSCGLRRSELINLAVTDIDSGRQLIKVMGKGKKERQVPISKELLRQLSDFAKLRSSELDRLEVSDHRHLFITEKGDPLYPKYVYNLVRSNLSTITTVERKSPHILRHSFATHLSDAGADLNAVKTLLGHSSLAATQVYMHNTVEKLKKIYDQAHPKS